MNQENTKQFAYPAHDKLYDFEMTDDLDFYAIKAEYKEMQARIESLTKALEKIEDIMAEFGDYPRDCFMIIGEHLDLFWHRTTSQVNQNDKLTTKE